MTPEEARAKIREIHRSVKCESCSLIWCGHSGCQRWVDVRDMYDWYPDRQAYRLKPEHRQLEIEGKPR